MKGSFLTGHTEVRHSLLYYELMIIVYAVTMQAGDNMSVMTIVIGWAIKWDRPSMTFWLISQNLVTHVTGCMLHVDPSYNNRYGPYKNSKELLLISSEVVR